MLALGQVGGHCFADFGRLFIQQTLGVLAPPVAVLLVAAVAHEVGYDAKEGQLFVVGHDAFVLGIVEVARAVKVEYVTEEFGVAVEKVLVGLVVIEELLLDGAEQRLWILFERGAPTLELVAAYVYRNFLVNSLLDMLERRYWQRVFLKYKNGKFDEFLEFYSC